MAHYSSLYSSPPVRLSQSLTHLQWFDSFRKNKETYFLSKESVIASFFMTTQQIDKHLDLAREQRNVVDDGGGGGENFS